MQDKIYNRRDNNLFLIVFFLIFPHLTTIRESMKHIFVLLDDQVSYQENPSGLSAFSDFVMKNHTDFKSLNIKMRSPILTSLSS